MPRWLRITPAELIGFALIYIAVRIIWLRLDLGSTTAFVVTILAIGVVFRFAWRARVR